MAKTEERINLDALAYNLTILYNIKQEIKNTTEDLEDFCESTSIKNQLQPTATIFEKNIVRNKNLILADILILNDSLSSFLVSSIFLGLNFELMRSTFNNAFFSVS